MENLRAFKVVTLPPTNNRPIKIKITDLRFDKSVIIGYTANGPGSENERVIEFLKEKGINIIAKAWREIKGQTHDYTILLTNNFDKQIK